MKKIISVDIDGVLADFVGAFLVIFNNKYDCNIQHKDIVCYEIDRALGVERKEFTDLISGVDHFTIPPLPGASEVLNRLSKEVTIRIVTSRYSSCSEDTYDWLLVNDIPFDDLVFVPPREGFFKTRETMDSIVHIDDDIREVIAFGALNKASIVYDWPWNKSSNVRNYFTRCASWEEIELEILKLL